MAIADDAPRFNSFGYTYMALRVLPCALLLLVFVGLSSRLPSDANSMLVVVCIVLIAYAAYAVVAGILAIKGNIAGVWMGLIELGLSLVIGLLGGASSDGRGLGGVGCGVVIAILLIVMGIKALGQHRDYQQRVVQGWSGGYAGGQPGGQFEQAGFVPPPVDYNQPYRMARTAPQAELPQTAQPAAPGMAVAYSNSPRGPSPRATVLEILAICASLEPDLVTARLERARTAALKLIGEKYSDEIARALAAPSGVVDPHARVAALGPMIAGNAKLVDSLRKCIVFVLKDGSAMSLAGEQFLSNYDLSVDDSVAS